jgi:hypothetical protein
MPNLNQIVDIQITRETRGISQVGFGTPMVLGQHTRFPERARIYTEIDGVAADFQTSDAEYKAAVAIFSQELRPEQIVIGRRTAKVAQVRTVSIALVANAFNYQVTVNGVTFQFTSDADATGAEIQAGLVAAVNAGAEPVTASPGVGTTVVLTADVAGTAFTSAVGTNLTIADTTANNGIVEDLEAVRALNDDWYMLCLTSRLEDDIMNAAAYIEALRKMFIACVEDTAVRDNTAGNVLEKLEAKGYDRTAMFWSDDQENYPEAAWMGRVLPLDPGSETWKFKRLQGIVASVLTATQASNILTKKGNTYEEFASAPITREGTVVSGEYIDVMRFVDWLEARMQEDIFQVLINVPKIPYTDGGVSVIESLVRKRLLIGVRVGGLAQDPEFTVTVPKVASIPANTKAQRLLPDVKFVATLAGAIHKIQIRGRVVL